jgi:LmeA-like phospholipid-binding
VSSDRTRPQSSPYAEPYPVRPRRGGRRLISLIVGLVVLAAILVGADRALAAYAANQAATQMQQKDGFQTKPQVTMEGFPFITQIIGHNLRDIHIASNSLKTGPVTASLVGDATGVRLNSDFQSGTVTRFAGTVLIPFGSVAGAIQAAGVPGVTVSAAGPDQVKIKVDLTVFTATATAAIAPAGPNKFKVHITDAGGLPTALLGQLGDFTIPVPPLPLGVTIQSVAVTSQGVVARVSASNFPFKNK